MSTMRRRSAGPSFTVRRSSGENSTPVMWPISSPERAASRPAILIFRLPMAGRMTSTSWLPSFFSARTCTEAKSASHLISSRSCRVRWLRPVQHRYSASSRFVLPWPLSPSSTFTPGQGANSQEA